MTEPALPEAANGAQMVVPWPRGRVLCCVAIVAATLIGGAGILCIRAVRPELPGGWLEDETFDRVQVGMSRDQVQAVIGPPRDTWNGHHASPYAFQFRERGYESWMGHQSELLVLFDSQGFSADVKRVPSFSTSKRSWWFW